MLKLGSIKNWPADAVERRSVASLIPYARNARTHSDAQVSQIAASIKEWGWTTPVLVDETGGIIAGHGRVMAARKLGLEEIPVMVATGWSEAQKRAYVLADNQLALNAGWDIDLLTVELNDLKDESFDLDLIGFDDKFLADIFAEKTEGLTDPDDAPAAPETPVAVLGDVWLLGKHRLVCGDSTDALTVEKALNGVKPHLMVTDPPYGVEYDASWRDKLPTQKPGTSLGKVENDNRANWSEAWSLFPGNIAYVWHDALRGGEIAENLLANGFKIRAQIIWAKQGFVFGRGDYHWQHEPCWYAVKKNGNWTGDRKQTTLWEIANLNKIKGGNADEKLTGHSTQKPVECMKRPIENNSSPGQAVYEPFSGSGTTIIAAEMTGRSCHAIELHPPYVDVAILRWQDFTGQQATLEGDGRTFAEIKAERHAT